MKAEQMIRLDGRRVVVVGGASGIGRAAADLAGSLGGLVTVMDVVPNGTPHPFQEIDLRDRASIDRALETCGRVDALLMCSGVANEAPAMELVNFIGQRHFLECLVDTGKVVRGSSVCMVSSVSGLNWDDATSSVEFVNNELMLDLLATPDFASASDWFASRPDRRTYRWAKQAVSAYVAHRAASLLEAGVRINATQPGPTDTPLAQANASWLAHGDSFRSGVGVRPALPIEQAWPIVFLVSDAASHIAGVNLRVDIGLSTDRLARRAPDWEAPGPERTAPGDTEEAKP